MKELCSPRLYVCEDVNSELIGHISRPQEFWKYFNSVSEKHVTHSDFMSILSNIEYILIKASYGQGLQQSRYLEASRTLPVFMI